MNAGPDDEGERTRERGGALILEKADLASSGTAYEFQGCRYGGADVSFIVIEGAPPGKGPKLHRHPYQEVFIVQEGEVTFTVGEEEIKASGGQVMVVPAGVPHKFVNSGAGPLRQVDIHPAGRFVTEWIED